MLAMSCWICSTIHPKVSWKNLFWRRQLCKQSCVLWRWRAKACVSSVLIWSKLLWKMLRIWWKRILTSLIIRSTNKKSSCDVPLNCETTLRAKLRTLSRENWTIDTSSWQQWLITSNWDESEDEDTGEKSGVLFIEIYKGGKNHDD